MRAWVRGSLTRGTYPTTSLRSRSRLGPVLLREGGAFSLCPGGVRVMWGCSSRAPARSPSPPPQEPARPGASTETPRPGQSTSTDSAAPAQALSAASTPQPNSATAPRSGRGTMREPDECAGVLLLVGRVVERSPAHPLVPSRAIRSHSSSTMSMSAALESRAVTCDSTREYPTRVGSPRTVTGLRSCSSRSAKQRSQDPH